jgi:hypothetical protein
MSATDYYGRPLDPAVPNDAPHVGDIVYFWRRDRSLWRECGEPVILPLGGAMYSNYEMVLAPHPDNGNSVPDGVASWPGLTDQVRVIPEVCSLPASGAWVADSNPMTGITFTSACYPGRVFTDENNLPPVHPVALDPIPYLAALKPYLPGLGVKA